MTIKTVLCAAVVLGAGAGFAQAEDMDPGQATYTQYCAGCHGMAGKADGPMAEQLTVKVADLTQLTKNNDGVFPMLDVIHIIDGR
ncbi:MAG TPA: c-type cytochrome, partial [Paracoccaceae bacterium]|nr:c-type cytochrome [Paracoccaceae bacterium]